MPKIDNDRLGELLVAENKITVLELMGIKTWEYYEKSMSLAAKINVSEYVDEEELKECTCGSCEECYNESEDEAVERHNLAEDEATGIKKMTVEALLADVKARERELAFLREDLRVTNTPAIKEHISPLIDKKSKALNELLDATVSYIINVPQDIKDANKIQDTFHNIVAYVSTEPWPKERNCGVCTALVNTTPEFAKAVCMYCKIITPKKAEKPRFKPNLTTEPKIITNLYPLVFSNTVISTNIEPRYTPVDRGECSEFNKKECDADSSVTYGDDNTCANNKDIECNDCDEVECDDCPGAHGCVDELDTDAFVSNDECNGTCAPNGCAADD